MIKYFCDLCEKECSNMKSFRIPIAATFIEQSPCDLIPIEMCLCNECRSKIYDTVTKIMSREKLEILNKLALDKMLGKI